MTQQQKPTSPQIPRLATRDGVPVGADQSGIAGTLASVTARLQALTDSIDRSEDANKKAHDRLEEGLLEVLSHVRSIDARVGTWPLGEDVVKRMQRESVKDATEEALAVRDARLKDAAEGTGLIGYIVRSIDNDKVLAKRDDAFARQLEEMAKSHAKLAAQEVVSDAADVAKTGNRKAVITGASIAAAVGTIIGLIQALGGADGIAKIIHG